MSRATLPVPDQPPFRARLGNVSYELTEQAVGDFFSGLSITEIVVMRHKDSGKAKSCFVEFRNKLDLENALTSDGSLLMGRPVQVQVAQPRERGISGSRASGRREKMSRKGRNISSNGASGTWTEPPMPSEESARARPKLKLKPRTVRADENNDGTKCHENGESNLFGGARPADTASKLAELELRDMAARKANMTDKGEQASRKPVYVNGSSRVAKSANGNTQKKGSWNSNKEARNNPVAKSAQVLQDEVVPTKVANPFELLADE